MGLSAYRHRQYAANVSPAHLLEPTKKRILSAE